MTCEHNLRVGDHVEWLATHRSGYRYRVAGPVVSVTRKTVRVRTREGLRYVRADRVQRVRGGR